MTPGQNFNDAASPAPPALAAAIYDELVATSPSGLKPDVKKIRKLISDGAQLSFYIPKWKQTVFEALVSRPELAQKLNDLPQWRGQLVIEAATLVPQDTERLTRVLERGNIDWTQTDEQGRTALMLAVKIGFDKNVKALLKHDPDIFRLDNAGNSVLMHAAWSGQMSLTELFIKMKLPVNQRTPLGYTAIDLALVGGDENQQGKWLTAARADIARMLARAGADIYRPNEKGISPVDFMAINGLDRAKGELIEAFAAYKAELYQSASKLASDVDAPIRASFKKPVNPLA